MDGFLAVTGPNYPFLEFFYLDANFFQRTLRLHGGTAKRHLAIQS